MKNYHNNMLQKMYCNNNNIAGCTSFRAATYGEDRIF